jgi:hypothetical protein
MEGKERSGVMKIKERGNRAKQNKTKTEEIAKRKTTQNVSETQGKQVMFARRRNGQKKGANRNKDARKRVS